MKGVGTARATPSTVTRPSSMTSSSADCVFGEARLISSASTTEAKIGPSWNSNSRFSWSKIVTPVTSEGSRSGVNWMREWLACTDAASARASEVLPVPGKSSSSRWPRENRHVSASRTTCSLPSTACSTLATRRPKASANCCACSAVVVVVPLVIVMRSCSRRAVLPRALLEDRTTGLRRDPDVRRAAAVVTVVGRRVAGVAQLGAAAAAHLDPVGTTLGETAALASGDAHPCLVGPTRPVLPVEDECTADAGGEGALAPAVRALRDQRSRHDRRRRVELGARVADVRPRDPLAVLVLHAQLEGVVLLPVAGDAGLAGPVGVLRRPVVDTDLRARDRGAVARGRVVPA